MKTDYLKTNKWKGKWGFLLEYPKLKESEAGNAQFPVYWYVIQEGCSSGLAQHRHKKERMS